MAPPTLTPFQDRVIAVTGGSRGAGLALVRYLLERGAKVSACATSEQNLAAAVAGIEKDMPEAKDRIMTTVVDIRKNDMVKAWYAAIEKEPQLLSSSCRLTDHLLLPLGSTPL